MSVRGWLRTWITAGQGTLSGLEDPPPGAEPFALFAAWFEAAAEAGLVLHEAMTLATASPQGRPSARQVLLKEHGPEGFVFYTNFGSRKVVDLDLNPQVALVLHWPVLLRQVRIEGRVERVSRDKAERYFHTRARGSQIGAWASRQSELLEVRETLEQRVAEVEARYRGQEVPLPPFWGGYRVLPERIEFWQGRASRLHDRLVFVRQAEGWRSERLYP